jgi:formylmethanofuran dehydrogenase subunit A
MTLLCLRGGTVYDPAHGIDGETRDVWIEDGRVVAPPADPERRADRTLDVTGLVVMPGGVDMHCHIAGPKVNTARKMMPDEKRIAPPVRRTARTRSGTGGTVPSTFATGYLYAGLGYTTAFDAAVPPLVARHVHEEFEDTPIIDKGFYVLMGNNHYVMRQLAENEPERLRNYVGWLIAATKGFACKLVNPGGVEVWKSGGGNAHGLDDAVGHFGVTPRQIITGVAQAAGELGMPHPVHVHCNNLGLPGNWTTTLETMKALEGRRGHITHIQFHSYGGDPEAQHSFRSEVPLLVEYVASLE